MIHTEREGERERGVIRRETNGVRVIKPVHGLCLAWHKVELVLMPARMEASIKTLTHLR